MAPLLELPLIIEGLLLASEIPLSLKQIAAAFPEESCPDDKEILTALETLAESSQLRSYELKQVASGYRLQIRQQFAPWIKQLKAEKPPRYTRALLETLALVVYRQPITRAEIEDVRGVSVGSNIIRTLLEREWIRLVGHREVPGRPALFGTTRQFLDYFNLSNLDELPPLSEVRNLDETIDLSEDPIERQSTLEVSKDSTETAPNSFLDNQADAKDKLFSELDQLDASLPENFETLISKKSTAQTNTLPSRNKTKDVLRLPENPPHEL